MSYTTVWRQNVGYMSMYMFLMMSISFLMFLLFISVHFKGLYCEILLYWYNANKDSSILIHRILLPATKLSWLSHSSDPRSHIHFLSRFTSFQFFTFGHPSVSSPLLTALSFLLTVTDRAWGIRAHPHTGSLPILDHHPPVSPLNSLMA